jgi:hypothetical protein
LPAREHAHPEQGDALRLLRVASSALLCAAVAAITLLLQLALLLFESRTLEEAGDALLGAAAGGRGAAGEGARHLPCGGTRTRTRAHARTQARRGARAHAVCVSFDVARYYRHLILLNPTPIARAVKMYSLQ